MSCHSRDGFKSSVRLAAQCTGLDRATVESLLHGLRAEATGTDLPAPAQAMVDEWYADALTTLEGTGLPTHRKDSIARGLLRARFEDTDGRDFYVQSNLLARAKQQAAVASVDGLVEMAPPGSQAHLYERGADGRPTQVYYASYGSNLYAARMNIYIEGGSPNNGRTVYGGARDQTPVQKTAPVALPGTVHYAGASSLWNGGVAFLDTTAVGRSLGRAHLISAEQFDDVVFQECNGNQSPDGTKVDLNATIRDGRTVGKGLYGTLQHVGDHDGVPVVTFTSPFTTADALRGDLTITAEGSLVPMAGREQAQADQRDTQVLENARAANEGREPIKVPQDWPVYSAAPSPAYEAMIGGGLVETHGLSPAGVSDYFGGATGYHHTRTPVTTTAPSAA